MSTQMIIITTLVRLNGLYDLLCGACLLNFIQFPLLNRLHTDMFHPTLINEFSSRLLGYWIITYGTIRLLCHMQTPLLSISYYLEAICLWHEMKYHPQYHRLLFTSVLSAYCGYIVLDLSSNCALSCH